MSDTHLQAVPDVPTEHPEREQPAPTDSGVPHFEGMSVDFSRVKLSGVAKLEAGEAWYRVDDVVRLYVEGRVTGIHHQVDGKTGKMFRVHTIQVVDAVPLPWNYDDATFGKD